MQLPKGSILESPVSAFFKLAKQPLLALGQEAGAMIGQRLAACAACLALSLI